MSINGGWYRRKFGNQTVTVDNRYSFANNSYDGPFCVNAPVDANLPDGGGYQVCGLYDLKPSVVAQNLPASSTIHFSSDYGGETNIYEGFEVSTTRALQARRVLPTSASTRRSASSISATWSNAGIVSAVDHRRPTEVAGGLPGRHQGLPSGSAVPSRRQAARLLHAAVRRRAERARISSAAACRPAARRRASWRPGARRRPVGDDARPRATRPARRPRRVNLMAVGAELRQPEPEPARRPRLEADQAGQGPRSASTSTPTTSSTATGRSRSATRSRPRPTATGCGRPTCSRRGSSRSARSSISRVARLDSDWSSRVRSSRRGAAFGLAALSRSGTLSSPCAVARRPHCVRVGA